MTVKADLRSGAFAWSWDGTRLAYVADDNSIRLAQAPVFGKPMRIGNGHGGVSKIIWPPQGGDLIYAKEDGSLWMLQGPGFVQTRRLSGPLGSVSQVAWSPDGRKLAVIGERPSDVHGGLWESIWLVDPQGNAPERDLLPPGSPFQAVGVRVILVITWLDDEEIFFSMNCGSGCAANYLINLSSGGYKSFCIGKGPLFWSPDKQTAVVQNNSSGPDAQGLGLVEVSNAVNLRPGQTAFQGQRECRSIFSGGPKIADPGEFPIFSAWFPDGHRVMYVDRRDKSDVRVWDTRTGQRETLVSNADGAVLSPDGRRVALDMIGRPQVNAKGRLIGGNGVKAEGTGLGVIDVRDNRVLGMASVRNRRRRSPEWSPDSRFVMYERDYLWRPDEVLVIRLDPNSSKTFQGDLPPAELSWAPAGKWLTVHLKPPELPPGVPYPASNGVQVPASAVIPGARIIPGSAQSDLPDKTRGDDATVTSPSTTKLYVVDLPM